MTSPVVDHAVEDAARPVARPRTKRAARPDRWMILIAAMMMMNLAIVLYIVINMPV